MKAKKTTKEKLGMASKASSGKNAGRAARIYYSVLPVVFAVLALGCSCIRFVLVKVNMEEQILYRYEIGITTLFDGNPNIIAILGCLSMLFCFLVIPKSMKKPHKSGDGLGAMFMPLGLLGIFVVMCTIENSKDMAIGICFGVILFLISALGTFKKTIAVVKPACLFMVLAALFLLLAGFMPYCYNKLPFIIQLDKETVGVSRYYYVSYFVRDLFLLLSYGIFADRIKSIYKTMEAK